MQGHGATEKVKEIAQEGGEGDHHHHHGDLVVYAPSDVLLLVESKSAKRVPSDPAFGFLGQPGDLFYELPQHEEEGLLFWESRLMSWKREFSQEIRFR